MACWEDFCRVFFRADALALDVAARDGISEGTHDQGVIIVGRRLRPECDDRVTRRLQVLDNGCLEPLTGVIRGDPDLHATVARTWSISLSLMAPWRRILI